MEELEAASTRFEGAMIVYGNDRLGKRPKHITIQHWCAAALAKDGKLPPANTKPMAWCKKNWDYIMEQSKKLYAAPKSPKSNVIARKNKKNNKAKKSASKTPTRTATSSVDPTANEFLLSFEWRRVRMEALKKYGPRCMCCGATPATGAVMNVDHIKPRKHFPHLALDINNLQILCETCNHGKGNWDRTDWRSAAHK